MKRLKLNCIMITAFSIFFLCIIIPVSVIFTLSALNNIKKESELYTETKTQQVEKVEEAFQSQLDLMEETATHLIYSRWLSRLINHIGLYKDEFDLYKRLEITSDIKSQLQSLEFVADIIVFIPQKDIFISSKGWFDAEEMLEYYPYISFPHENTSDNPANIQIQSSQDTILSLVYKSMLSIDCYIYMLVDVNAIDRYILRASLEQFTAYEVYQYDEVLSRLQSPEELQDSDSIYTGTVLPGGFQLRIWYTLYRNDLTATILTLVLILVIGAIIAAFLAYSTTKPINRILNNLFNMKKLSVKNNYFMLPDYVDSMITNNSYLTKQLEQYKKVVESESLFRLLTDKSAAMQPDNFILEIIPWAKKRLTYRILLFVKKKSSEYIDESAIRECLSANSIHCINVTMPNCDMTFILWYEYHKYDEAQTQFLDEYTSEWFVASSEQHVDFTQISAMYVQAKERLDLQLEWGGVRPVSEQIPLSLEIKLINAIQENRVPECKKTLQLMLKRSDNSKANIIMMLIVRLANEHSINCQKYVNQYNEDLHKALDTGLQSIIHDFCEHLCVEIEKAKTRSVSDAAQLIQKYVLDHFDDNNMSLKLLSDVFHISPPFLSKMFKAEININFACYLQDIRIKEAKRLLSGSDITIIDVSQKVGYTNYLTFKRAFIRAIGVSPREYREQV